MLTTGTAAAHAKQFGVKLIKCFAENCECFSSASAFQVPGLCNKCLHLSLLVVILRLILISLKANAECLSICISFIQIQYTESVQIYRNAVNYMHRIFKFLALNAGIAISNNTCVVVTCITEIANTLAAWRSG